MPVMNLHSEVALRQRFKQLNRVMILLWRLGLGRMINMAPEQSGRIMVLTHVGRKSGRRYRTPVNYAEVGGKIYCTAGFGSVSDWYRNVLATPDVELWLPNGRWLARARDVSDAPNRLELMRAVLLASGFAAGAAGVDPRQMSDHELDEATQAYRLLELELSESVRGPNGPGDLAWVWPAVGGVGLLATWLLLLRRRHS